MIMIMVTKHLWLIQAAASAAVWEYHLNEYVCVYGKACDKMFNII